MEEFKAGSKVNILIPDSNPKKAKITYKGSKIEFIENMNIKVTPERCECEMTVSSGDIKINDAVVKTIYDGRINRIKSYLEKYDNGELNGWGIKEFAMFLKETIEINPSISQ